MKEETKCPCCPNHCDSNNLSCGRGREYFNKENTSYEPQTLNEKIIHDLKKCGHLLHHNKELDTSVVLSIFTDEELMQLHELLSKFYNNVK